MEKQRTYVCIDMKSFYASVECAERHLSPFETNLVVADETRGKGAITLAISPKMKSLGVKTVVVYLKSHKYGLHNRDAANEFIHKILCRYF